MATTNLPLPERALAIAAHPDDVEFECGATLAKWAAAGKVHERIRVPRLSIGSSYNAGDRPIYRYPLFRNRAFSVNARDIWPAELLAATLYPDDISLGHYDYDAVRCPEAESFLKRSFWLRMDETHTPRDALTAAEAIVGGFAEAGIA